MDILIHEPKSSHESAPLIEQKNNKRKLGEIIQILSGSRKRKCVKKMSDDVEARNIPVPMME